MKIREGPGGGLAGGDDLPALSDSSPDPAKVAHRGPQPPGPGAPVVAADAVLASWLFSLFFLALMLAGFYRFLGARAGLGYVINYAYGLLMTEEYAVLVMLVAATVLAIDGAGALLEARVKRWAG